MNDNEEPTKRWYVDLDKIGKEFLKYAPAYAQAEAQTAIVKIMDLQKQGLIRHGLYYVVLVDVVGSTKFAAEHGNSAASERIKFFITQSFNALNAAHVNNIGLFVKEIGDAVLYIFQHFPDILRWLSEFSKWLGFVTFRSEEERYVLRTCVNLGEVFLDGVNPLSLAVSQTFKMEKSVPADSIVLTEAAYSVAWPTIARAYHAFEPAGCVELDGYKKPVPLYKLNVHDKDDLARIATEKL